MCVYEMPAFPLSQLCFLEHNLVEREGKSFCYEVGKRQRRGSGPQDDHVLGHWKGLRPLSKGNGGSEQEIKFLKLYSPLSLEPIAPLQTK